MLDTVWRVSGKDFDVDYFLEYFQIQDRSAVFRQGEKGLRGQIAKKSGFNVSVSEKLNSSDNMGEIEQFIQNNGNAFIYLLNNGIASSFDIGCTVGTTDQFTKSVTVPLSLLSLLHQYGIEIQFSAYPTSEDEDNT